ncbi:uncharacterized protein LOC116848450 [Odontomachus brunneus]|uniref:uncharacterized protein LOC116848450 n=1 Tax=Odontomachus brunneus TaxID=486640 RepID=UPI0013F2211C|nr:uncharacterized protein LOC116848450 [Odontomachus brunneus]
MSPRKIIKALKYGLLSLSPEELKYFRDFGAEVNVVNNADMWSKKLDVKLIWNLIVAGLTENQCWNIVMCGLMPQDKNVLCRLLWSGVNVPGILNWPGQIKPVTSTIVTFLEKLGIDEDALRYVEENGIDDVVEDMLIDLGYSEYEEKQALEEILCECSLSILQSTAFSLTTRISRSTSLSGADSTLSTQYDFAPCTCYLNLLSKEQGDETVKRNNYLRQNVMIPLTWAISRTLKYQPTNPQHYIAHQLLRWRYGNVPQEEMDSIQQFVVSATIAMDRKLVEKRKREEEDAIRRLNETAVKDIICDTCLKRQKLYRIKSESVVGNVQES